MIPQDSTRPLLDIENLFVDYNIRNGTVRAVNNISFSVQKGEAVAIVGESGAGKSSIALALMRLLPKETAACEGKLSLSGTNYLNLDQHTFRKEIRWQIISIVFQSAMDSLNPVVRVGQQVIEPLLIRKEVSREEAKREGLRLLETVRLPHEIYDRYPHELSGGMKQRILIAMSLILKPQLVIMDEPTSSLDVTVQAQIMNLLKELKRELGLGIIFITHDIALASDLCDTIGVMYSGKIVEIGTADQVLLKPRHPYTQLLLASIPRLHSQDRPKFIPGYHPNLEKDLQGCHFHPRCPYVLERCSYEDPPLITSTNSSHKTLCWLLTKK
jgi:oligopeptide/dipeptide ABC transporter ATP-binding protein